jgi:hypothetical protein
VHMALRKSVSCGRIYQRSSRNGGRTCGIDRKCKELERRWVHMSVAIGIFSRQSVRHRANSAAIANISACLILLCNRDLCAQPPSFRYFYDDANELYRVLDSTGTLIEYTIDPSGNITNIARTSLPPTQLSILSVSPSNATTGLCPRVGIRPALKHPF